MNKKKLFTCQSPLRPSILHLFRSSTTEMFVKYKYVARDDKHPVFYYCNSVEKKERVGQENDELNGINAENERFSVYVSGCVCAMNKNSISTSQKVVACRWRQQILIYTEKYLYFKTRCRTDLDVEYPSMKDINTRISIIEIGTLSFSPSTFIPPPVHHMTTVFVIIYRMLPNDKHNGICCRLF